MNDGDRLDHRDHCALLDIADGAYLADTLNQVLDASRLVPGNVTALITSAPSLITVTLP